MGHFVHGGLDLIRGTQEVSHEYTHSRQCKPAFGSIIRIASTVLNFIQVAYLLISTCTGAPWPELNLAVEVAKRGEQIFCNLFNINDYYNIL
jgi:hypothetical protein